VVWLKRALAIVLATTAAGYLGWTTSPWPSALFYRVLFDRGGVAMNHALARHVPQGVLAQTDIAYAAGDPDAWLDIFRPASAGGRPLPVVVWIHGGAFLSGSKDQVSNYLRLLAARGYAAVGIDYTLAPRGRYPGPVVQANAALRFLQENAERFGLDASRFFLAGDSAGAQIAAQLAAAIGSPDYAAGLRLKPSIAREHLRGAILFCGFHDLEAINPSGAFGGLLRTATWSYFGAKDLTGDRRAAEFSTVNNVSSAFPALFISAGNADPLLSQSQKLADMAKAHSVVVDSLFFPAHRSPGLAHEYQFDLDNDAGKGAFERMIAFLARFSA
jgi:acetyl esterase/lipase